MNADRFIMMAVANCRDVMDATLIQTLPEYTEVTFTCDRQAHPRLCDRLAIETTINYIWQRGWLDRLRLKLNPIVLSGALIQSLMLHINEVFARPYTSVLVIRFDANGNIKFTYESEAPNEK